MENTYVKCMLSILCREEDDRSGDTIAHFLCVSQEVWQNMMYVTRMGSRQTLK